MKDVQYPFFRLLQGIPVCTIFFFIFEKVVIDLYNDTDLNELGMTVNTASIGFGITDLNACFLNDRLNLRSLQK